MDINPIELPHKIKGASANYRKEFDGTSKQLIADYYQEEIEMFGYSFDT